MKKQFWVDILLILLLLCSCTTIKESNENVVNAAISLANRQVELNQLEDAVNTYNCAIASENDYRLYYNKAVVQAKLGLLNDAIDTAKFAASKYIDKEKEFANLQEEFHIMLKDYDYALNLWQEGNYNMAILEVLYEKNPSEWEVLYNVLKNY